MHGNSRVTAGSHLLAMLLLSTVALASEAPLPEPKPVPRLQVVPQPYGQASFQREGVEITRYHFGDGLERPFLFPVIGPSGRSLTRMGHRARQAPAPALRPLHPQRYEIHGRHRSGVEAVQQSAGALRKFLKCGFSHVPLIFALLLSKLAKSA